ncbi:unnamed protein product [Prorocentrum cordatum]|uniref:Pentatricopeptide repeat-containing protein n=1 Tax=Prorocentrum cordatum TaxID=2364126 RepID=A0ABN9WQ55_9DINO|nr:unnamed protein product [Polarella glacialis]
MAPAASHGAFGSHATLRFNAVMNAHAESGDPAGAAAWFGRLCEAGLRPTAASFRVLLKSCGRGGDAAAAWRWLGAMAEAAVEVDAAAWRLRAAHGPPASRRTGPSSPRWARRWARGGGRSCARNSAGQCMPRPAVRRAPGPGGAKVVPPRERRVDPPPSDLYILCWNCGAHCSQRPLLKARCRNRLEMGTKVALDRILAG